MPRQAGSCRSCRTLRRENSVQRTFGNLATRLLRGGHVLSTAEHHILVQLVLHLPDQLRLRVEAQFNSYNLVQREVDKRALNFYRVKIGRSGALPVSPLLKSKLEEAPLMRLCFSVRGESQPLHAALTAVRGVAFCVSFDRPVPAEKAPGDFAIAKVTQSWQSNFNLDEVAA
jgi:hypothetical protein